MEGNSGFERQSETKHEVNFFRGKTFLLMVKQGRQNHPHNQALIIFVLCPASNETAG